MRVRAVSVAVLAVVATLGLPMVAAHAAALTIVVNTNGDKADLNGTDAVCDSLFTAGNQCTLRAAIQTANATANPIHHQDAIHFAIGTVVVTIQVGVATGVNLPPVTDAVTIDGTTQPGSGPTCLVELGHPCVELDGEQLGSTGIGLRINSGHTTVRGLVVNRFGDTGIVLDQFGTDVIAGNEIGTDPAGTSERPNGIGITVVGGPNQTIGGITPAARNIISGNDTFGIRLQSAGALVEGNYIGTDITGTADLGQNIAVAAEAANEKIGGAAGGAGNVISGNSVGIDFESTGGLAQGNLIGTDATGTVSLHNNLGIQASGSTTIGGTSPAARNVISGNNTTGLAIGSLIGGVTDGVVVQGNYIGTDITGSAAVPNVRFGIVTVRATNTQIGGTDPGAGNLISGNGSGVGSALGVGILISGPDSSGNVVEGNLIGTDATGAAALPNQFGGVEIATSAGDRIGGTTAAARNVISGNGHNGRGQGVLIFGDDTSGEVVEGNFIGTDAAGTAAVPNLEFGVVLVGGTGNHVGGTDPGAGNVVSGNGGIGIGVTVGRGNVPAQNVVQGNLVGTDASGGAALGNGDFGIEISGSKTVVGGTAAAAANVVSANAAGGIRVLQGKDQNNNPVGGTGNRIVGNLIGTEADGVSPLPNTGPGVDPTGSIRTLIGGPQAGAGNVISANTASGVASGVGTVAARVLGNFIGTDRAKAADIGNGGPGVQSRGGMAVGGGTAGAANAIADNAGDGVAVLAGKVRILRNSIHDNDGLGIDLGDDGVTANDPGDGDTGPNRLQNFPALSSAVTTGGSTDIQGTLHSAGGVKFVLRFFSSGACDPSTNGEGATFLGQLAVLTTAAGAATFTFTPAAPVAAGKQVTATATDPKGDTSEFSKCRAVTAA